jgi:hypothetical protein
MPSPFSKTTLERLNFLNCNTVQHLKLLLERVAHCAVVVELRSTTRVTCDALGQTRGNIVTGFHPVDQGMTEHVTSEV